MILLSKLADYGVVLMVRLALDGERQVNTSALADDTHLAEPTIAKVLKTLVRAGLVTSVRGPSGGYRLARRADAITVADIVTAIDGPFGITECATDEVSCERSSFCVTRPHWHRINTAVEAALSSVTLAEMTPSMDRFRFDAVASLPESVRP